MYKLAELRQCKRVRGLPHDFIPISGENPMEAIDQGAATTSQVGDNVVVESGVPYSSQSPPLVQQPSWEDSSFLLPQKVILMIPIHILVLMLLFGRPLLDRPLPHLAPV